MAKAPADGYTLLFGTLGTQAINPALYKKLPYDATKDFTPIALFADVPNVLVVNPTKLPVKTVQEFIDYSKKHPGTLHMGSSGNGSSNHLSGELFKSMTGADFMHVPYKGSAPATTDLLGGQIQLIFDNLPGALPHIKAGRERALAVTSAKRSPLLPDVPTVAEAGVKGYEAGVWFGILGPRGLPAEVVDRIAKEMDVMVRDKPFVEKIDQAGATLTPSNPTSFAARIRADMEKWAKVVKDSGATVD